VGGRQGAGRKTPSPPAPLPKARGERRPHPETGEGRRYLLKLKTPPRGLFLMSQARRLSISSKRDPAPAGPAPVERLFGHYMQAVNRCSPFSPLVRPRLTAGGGQEGKTAKWAVEPAFLVAKQVLHWGRPSGGRIILRTVTNERFDTNPKRQQRNDFAASLTLRVSVSCNRSQHKSTDRAPP
jgi:hypothetical protein